jgi:hypothetical protein
MLRRVLASVFFAVLVSTAASFAQAPPRLLTGTPFSRTVFLSLDAVQAQVDATLLHEATSRVLIAAALAQAPPPLLKSTPIPRR